MLLSITGCSHMVLSILSIAECMVSPTENLYWAASTFSGMGTKAEPQRIMVGLCYGHI